MQALEAMQHLINTADRFTGTMADTQNAVEQEEFENTQLAISVVTAMLNTALPIARFRCHVEVDTDQPTRTKSEAKKAIHSEFTVCGVTIDSIRSGLLGLAEAPTNVRVLIFEQRATGADVLTGFQGRSKTAKYRSFLASLDSLQAPTQSVN